MHIDLASGSAVRVALADSRQTPPEGTRSRSSALAALLAASPLQLAVLALAVLLGGIGLAIISTTDPVWWQEHFSRLGTFDDASSAMFNGALLIGGVVVQLFARAVERELRPLARIHVRRGTARTARILFSAIGASLALTGCIPLDVNTFVHEHITMVMVGGFAGLLLTSPFLMHRMPKRLLASTIVAFSYLVAGAWMFFGAGTINLALFEVIAFSAMFGWSAVFVFCLSRCAAAAAVVPAAASVPAVVPAPAVATVEARSAQVRERADADGAPARAAAPAPRTEILPSPAVAMAAPAEAMAPADSVAAAAGRPAEGRMPTGIRPCTPVRMRRPVMLLRRRMPAAQRSVSRRGARVLSRAAAARYAASSFRSADSAVSERSRVRPRA